jgi:hypothetical protein
MSVILNRCWYLTLEELKCPILILQGFEFFNGLILQGFEFFNGLILQGFNSSRV